MLPTPAESQPLAGTISGASTPRDGARPMPDGEVVRRLALDDVMPAGSRRGS
jgi:hypothetical protein